MTAAAALLLLLHAFGEDPTRQRPSDRAEFAVSEAGASVDWVDAEDRVQLAVRPGKPQAGETLSFSVQVGSFQGAAEAGPVVLSLRPPDGRAVVDVPLTPAVKGGFTGVYAPEVEGTWTVDVRFRTTRAKHLQADLPVAPPRRFPWLELSGLVGLAAFLTWVGWHATATRSGRPPASPEPTSVEAAPPGP